MKGVGHLEKHFGVGQHEQWMLPGNDGEADGKLIAEGWAEIDKQTKNIQNKLWKKEKKRKGK